MTASENPTIDRDRILADTARILEVEVDDIDPAVSLVDQGLDSVRLMALVEQWRDGGADVDFVTLATEPDLELWYSLLDPR